MTDKAKGPGRGNGYKPRFAPCKKCGEMFWKDTARRVYCDECRLVRQEERIEEQRARARERYRRNREGLIPPKKLPKVPEPRKGFKPHECLVWKWCQYGSEFKAGCNYFDITGELRTKGGRFQIKEGRCARFCPKKGRKKPGWRHRGKGGDTE